MALLVLFFSSITAPFTNFYQDLELSKLLFTDNAKKADTKEVKTLEKPPVLSWFAMKRELVFQHREPFNYLFIH